MQQDKVLRTKDLVVKLGVSRTSIWRWQASDYLPKRRRFGPNVVGWLTSEIEDWISTRPKFDDPASASPSPRSLDNFA